jgi:hypothetical protein
MTIYLNDKLVCKSTADYTTSFESKAGAKEWTTISKMSDCNDVLNVKKGDRIKINAEYDEKLHPL